MSIIITVTRRGGSQEEFNSIKNFLEASPANIDSVQIYLGEDATEATRQELLAGLRNFLDYPIELKTLGLSGKFSDDLTLWEPLADVLKNKDVKINWPGKSVVKEFVRPLAWVVKIEKIEPVIYPERASDSRYLITETLDEMTKQEPNTYVFTLNPKGVHFVKAGGEILPCEFRDNPPFDDYIEQLKSKRVSAEEDASEGNASPLLSSDELNRINRLIKNPPHPKVESFEPKKQKKGRAVAAEAEVAEAEAAEVAAEPEIPMVKRKSAQYSWVTIYGAQRTIISLPTSLKFGDQAVMIATDSLLSPKLWATLPEPAQALLEKTIVDEYGRELDQKQGDQFYLVRRKPVILKSPYLFDGLILPLDWLEKTLPASVLEVDSYRSDSPALTKHLALRKLTDPLARGIGTSLGRRPAIIPRTGAQLRLAQVRREDLNTFFSKPPFVMLEKYDGMSITLYRDENGRERLFTHEEEIDWDGHIGKYIKANYDLEKLPKGHGIQLELFGEDINGDLYALGKKKTDTKQKQYDLRVFRVFTSSTSSRIEIFSREAMLAFIEKMNQNLLSDKKSWVNAKPASNKNNPEGVFCDLSQYATAEEKVAALVAAVNNDLVPEMSEASQRIAEGIILRNSEGEEIKVISQPYLDFKEEQKKAAKKEKYDRPGNKGGPRLHDRSGEKDKPKGNEDKPKGKHKKVGVKAQAGADASPTQDASAADTDGDKADKSDKKRPGFSS